VNIMNYKKLIAGATIALSCLAGCTQNTLTQNNRKPNYGPSNETINSVLSDSSYVQLAKPAIVYESAFGENLNNEFVDTKKNKKSRRQKAIEDAFRIE